tara:strand:- start:2126 stop:2602 length:477 start_codon:yes stop_codon:yes gene_type:complete
MKTFSKENLKKYALNYLNRYASSKKNLELILLRKVKKLRVEERDYGSYIKIILKELEDNKIINDENLANSIAFTYARNGKSKKIIKYHLIKKGIKSKDINNALEKLEDEIPDFEYESAMIFAKKKKLGKFGKLYNKEKDLSKMARAGFSYDLIKKILN